jgi:hypothetical protein
MTFFILLCIIIAAIVIYNCYKYYKSLNTTTKKKVLRKNYWNNYRNNKLKKNNEHPAIKFMKLGDYLLDRVGDKKRALKCYSLSARHGNLSALLSIADIHYYSVYDDFHSTNPITNPVVMMEVTKALSIYDRIIDNKESFPRAVVTLAVSRREEILNKINEERDNYYNHYNYYNHDNQYNNYNHDNHYNYYEPEFDLQIQQAIYEGIQQRRETEGGGDEIQQFNYMNDSQNVHDHVVQNSIKKIVDKIRSVKVSSDNNDGNDREFDELIEFARNNGKNDAIRVIEHIKQTNPYLSKHNTYTSDALKKVWNIVKNDKDKSMNLCIELESAIENDSIVCATGVFSRIINSLNDGENNVIIDTNILKEEMMNKIGVIRQQFYDKLSDEDKRVFDDNDENNNRQKELIDKLKSEIHEKFNADYVDSGLCDKEIKDDIEKELLEYL